MIDICDDAHVMWYLLPVPVVWCGGPGGIALGKVVSSHCVYVSHVVIV